MYIGEISKPSVDKTELKKKPIIATAEPIDAPRKVADQLDLSDEAKRRQQKESTLKNDKRVQEQVSEETPKAPSENSPHIDFNA